MQRSQNAYAGPQNLIVLALAALVACQRTAPGEPPRDAAGPREDASLVADLGPARDADASSPDAGANDAGSPALPCPVSGLEGGGTGRRIRLSTTAPGEIYRPDLSALALAPNDVIVIPEGSYSAGITLGNFAGADGAPITITHEGVVASAYLRIRRARHFRLVGESIAGAFGFRVVGPANAGVAISVESSDFEVSGLEVSGVEAGMLIKTNPDATNPATVYPNHVIANVRIHDNYVHDVSGEGMYLGHTYPNADPYSGDLIPTRMSRVHVWNNTVEDTGWDGIQLSNAREDAILCGNTVRRFGLQNMGSQRAGIILGGNTEGRIQHNIIEDGTGNGIEVFGYGSCDILDNLVIRSATTAGEDAIYVSQNGVSVEDNPALRVTTRGNTVAEASRSLIRHANNSGSMLPGFITENRLCDARSRPLRELVVTNALDEVRDNVIVAACP